MMEYKINIKPTFVFSFSRRDCQLTLRVEGETRAYRPGDETGKLIDRHLEVMAWDLDGAPEEVEYYRKVITDLQKKVTRVLVGRLAVIKAAAQAVESVEGGAILTHEEENC